MIGDKTSSTNENTVTLVRLTNNSYTKSTWGMRPGGRENVRKKMNILACVCDCMCVLHFSLNMQISHVLVRPEKLNILMCLLHFSLNISKGALC